MRFMYKDKINTAKPESGAYLGVPFGTYTEIEAMNNSRLKKILKSPAHFAQDSHHDSTAFVMGRLVHELVLTPEVFDRNWAIYDGATRRGKAWDTFKAENEGKDICMSKEYEEAITLTGAVLASDLGKEYFEGDGHSEVTMVWEEEIDGERVTLKCRQDRMQDGLADLKTTTATDQAGFTRDARKYQYDMQAAFYMRGYRAVMGKDLSPEQFVFVTIEKATKIVCGYYLPEYALQVGWEKVDTALHRYVDCLRSDEWLGPNEGKLVELTDFVPEDTFSGSLNFEGLAVEEIAA